MFCCFCIAFSLLSWRRSGHRTKEWESHRAHLINDVYGKGPGVLPTQSVPDHTLTWPEDTDPRSKGWCNPRPAPRHPRVGGLDPMGLSVWSPRGDVPSQLLDPGVGGMLASVDFRFPI